MDKITKTTHPLILAAAASVTIASLAAAAHFAGLIPSRANDTPVAAPLAAPAPAPTAEAEPVPAAKAPEASRPAAKPHLQHQRHEAAQPTRQGETEAVRQPRRSDGDWRYQSGTHRVSTNNAGIDVIPSSSAPAPAPAAAPPACHECGTVESIREVAAQGEGTGLGAIAGGVLGGILGHQVGRGSGKDLATIAGAVGGAVAGHQVEKNVRTDKQFQVAVRFDDGAVRTYTQGNANLHNGDRVRVANGNLVQITPDER